jgi:hypothetical protein
VDEVYADVRFIRLSKEGQSFPSFLSFAVYLDVSPEEEAEKFVNLVSSLDSSTTHFEVSRKRPGTGSWLLDAQALRSCLNGDSKTVLCFGIRKFRCNPAIYILTAAF